MAVPEIGRERALVGRRLQVRPHALLLRTVSSLTGTRWFVLRLANLKLIFEELS
jgi:hypothetical protein